jgi:hypothetical protein
MGKTRAAYPPEFRRWCRGPQVVTEDASSADCARPTVVDGMRPESRVRN